jgi:hypothetical protein
VRLGMAESNRAIMILMPTHKLTDEILNAAILGFEEQKSRIDVKIAEIRQMLDGSGRTEPNATAEVPKGMRRKLSAAARKRIGDAQRRRWAESKGQSDSRSETVTAKPKRKLSVAGRRAISEATKKRWAVKRAAAAKPETPVAKKAASKKGAATKVTAKRPIRTRAKARSQTVSDAVGQ